MVEPDSLLNLVINGGGTAVMVWVIIGMRDDIKALRQELRDQNVRMWGLIEWAFKEGSNTALAQWAASEREQAENS
jgi:hypothetical protein